MTKQHGGCLFPAMLFLCEILVSGARFFTKCRVCDKIGKTVKEG